MGPCFCTASCLLSVNFFLLICVFFHFSARLQKVWINHGDIVLVGLRDFQDDKCDVLLKYTTDEARDLKANNELPDTIQINEGETFGEEDTGEVIFDTVDDDDELDDDNDDFGMGRRAAAGRMGGLDEDDDEDEDEED